MSTIPMEGDGGHPVAIGGGLWERLYPYWVMLLLMIVAILSYMDRGILNLLIDPIKIALNLSEVAVSVLIGPAFIVCYAGMGLVFGRWADRHNRRNLILAGLVSWSIMTGLCGLAEGFALLLVARMGVGMGEATLGPSAYSLIADYFPPHRRGLAMSIYSSGVTIGSGLAFIIGGLVIRWANAEKAMHFPLIGHVASWQVPFLVLCVPGLFIALVLLTVREPARTLSGVRELDSPSIRAVFAFVRTRYRVFLPIIAGYSMLIGAAVLSVVWIPAFYMRIHGMLPGQFGVIFGTIYCVAGTAGLFVGGMLSDRLTTRGKLEAPILIVLWSMLGCYPFFIAALLVSSTVLSFVFMAIAIFVMLLHGALQAVSVQLLVPNRMRGQLGAAYLITVNLIATGLMPPITAWMTEHLYGGPLGLRWSLITTLTAILPVGALLVTLGLPHARRLARDLNP